MLRRMLRRMNIHARLKLPAPLNSRVDGMAMPLSLAMFRSCRLCARGADNSACNPWRQWCRRGAYLQILEGVRLRLLHVLRGLGCIRVLHRGRRSA